MVDGTNGSNIFDDEGGNAEVQVHIEAFLSALGDHPSLEELHLRRCGVKDGLVHRIFNVLDQNDYGNHAHERGCRLRELSLVSNSFSCTGTWVEQIPKLQHLQTLILPHGMLTSADVRRLVEALQRNLCLTHLSFGGMVMNQMRPYLERNELCRQVLSLRVVSTTQPRHEFSSDSSVKTPISSSEVNNTKSTVGGGMIEKTISVALAPLILQRLGGNNDFGAAAVFPFVQNCLAEDLF